MILRLFSLLRDTPDRRPLWIFLLCAAAAVGFGFVFVSPESAEALIVKGGYYYMLALFVAFLVFAARVAARRQAVWIRWLRRPGWVGVALLTATGFAVWADTFAHKVLFDEYVLQGTAWHMHATKEVGTPIRAFDFAGTWLAVDTFLDKRPYFFTFLLSLLHDLSGFRLENAFALNVSLAFLTLALAYSLARAITGRTASALIAVALLATLPLFGQNATGAGMELHNLAMLAVVMTCAVLYLRVPDADRLSLLVLATALLAQCRYESVIFVLPAGIVIVLGWLRRREVLLPPAAIIAPLLLVPYAWHDRFVGTRPVLWQLREGDTARFAWKYLSGNLEGAWRFFFNASPSIPNSLWLTLLGLAGLVWALIIYVRSSSARRLASQPFPPGLVVLGLFGAGITANLGLLMFYYWSRLDEPIAARFALPFYFALALVSAWLVRSLDGLRVPATRVAVLGLAIWLAVWAAPAYARRTYTTQNLVMHEIEWEVEQVTSHRRPLLLITNKATMPFLLERVSAVHIPMARARVAQISWHMNQGTFHEVLVSQVLRSTSANGDLGVDPNDVLPKEFEMETLAQKRFGARWIRISRLVKINDSTEAIPESGSDSVVTR